MTDKSPECLTPAKAIQILQRLTQDESFARLDAQNREIIRPLYDSLRKLFSTTTTVSQANRVRVLRLERLELVGSLQARFSQFEEDPLAFWNGLTLGLPQYGLEEPKIRAKSFLERAAQLESTVQEQLVLRRFVAVAAFKLFRRAIPTVNHQIPKQALARFLDQVGISSSESNIEKYGYLLKRGQRIVRFCQELKAGKLRSTHFGDDDMNNGCEGNRGDDNGNYGPLFFLSLPDAM